MQNLKNLKIITIYSILLLPSKIPMIALTLLIVKFGIELKVLAEKILIISFVFELFSKIELENQIYLKKLNQIIDSSEILV